MNIMIVDDEQLALEHMMSIASIARPEANIEGFQKASDALQALRSKVFDVVLLDIEMAEMNGIAFAKASKDIRPTINIIFVTGYRQYAIEALRLHVSGYLLKPVEKDELSKELEYLRNPITSRSTKKVRIQTFGNFDVFLDDQPVHFSMAKCKECLAYLVDRKGAFVTTGEIAGILWEDRPYDKVVQNNTHRVISDLLKTLKQHNIRNIINKERREMAIRVDEVDCDYFQFLQGDVSYINAFRGEYMSNYSWAEFTLSSITIL